MPATMKHAGWRVGLSSLGLGLVLAMAPAWSQTATKTTPDLIRAATGKVDGAMIVANASKQHPRLAQLRSGLRRNPPLHAEADHRRQRGLGLVWSYNLESTRGVEATPLVVDGIMYVTASWSMVHAIDARTGKRLWTFDPKVPAPRLQRLLRRGQPRRGAVRGQGVRRCL